jgi:uncharacterized protein YcnI
MSTSDKEIPLQRYIVLAAAGAALAVVPAAAAHISPTPSTAPAGQSSVISFRVGHGCDGSPTRQLTMQVPAGVTSAKPKAKPGWRIAVKTGRLAQPIRDSHGNMVRTGVTQITWSGGNLPDAWFDTFDVQVGMPAKVGSTVYFPFVQRCARGVARWITIPARGEPEPETPAPAVRLVKGGAAHG